MSLDQLGLGFVFGVKDQASDVLARLRRDLSHTKQTGQDAAKGVNDAFKKLGGGGAEARGMDTWAATKDIAHSMVAPGLGMVDAMFGAAKASSDFEGMITRVGLVSQASAEDLKALSAAAIQAGIKTQFNPTQAAQGLENLASQGFNAQDSIKALVPALDLAAAGGIAVEQAASAMTSAVKVFGLEVGDAGAAADKMLKIANATALGAKDLEIAMGTIGRGASVTKQSLDEMLPAIGLVKNTGVDASVAASSVSAALIHMAGSAKEFKKIGVEVTDAKGQFRPFLDVVLESSAALDKKFPNAAQRVAAAEKLFARFGLTAYSAISTQLGKGVTDASGKLYQGAAAVKFLRGEMAGAGGTAEKFRDKLLNSFGGQMVLLKGSTETFRILFGQGIAAVLKPVVKLVTDGLNKVLEFMQRLSPEAKRTFALFAGGVATFTLLTGAGIAAVAVFKVLGPLLVSSAISFASAMLPVTLAVGALGLVGAGVFMTAKQNVGGLGDTVAAVGKKINLAVNALSQLFSRGWMNEKTGGELLKDENAGVLGFVKRVYLWGNRISNFFGGLWSGFTAAIERAAPTFHRLADAFGRFAAALGLNTATTIEENAKAFDEWGQQGAKVGGVLATIADVGATVLASSLEALAGMVTQLRKDWPQLKADFHDGVSALRELSRATGEVVGLFRGGSTDAAGFGSAIVKAFTMVFRGINNLTAPVRAFLTALAWVGNAIAAVFSGIGFSFRGLINGLLQGVLTLVQGSLSVLQVPLRMLGKGAMVDSWKASLEGTKGRLSGWAANTGTGAAISHNTPEGAMSLESPMASMPEQNASTEETNALLRQLVVQAQTESGRAMRESNMSVYLDRQKVGEIMRSESREHATASFDPGMSFASE